VRSSESEMTSPQNDLAVTDRPVRGFVAGSRTLTRLLIIATDAHSLVAHHLPLACAARQAGYEVHVAAPVDRGKVAAGDAASRAIREASIAFHALPAHQEETKVLSGYANLRALASLIGALRPALVHCLGPAAVLYGGAIARLKGLAAVHAATDLSAAISEHRPGKRFHRFAVISALAFAMGNRRAYVAVGSADERTVLSRLGVIDPKRALVLHGIGIDLKLFRPRDDAEQGHKGPLVVMHAGPLTADGGAREFVALARRMRAKGVPLRFALVGARNAADPGCIPEVEISRWLAEGEVDWWGDSRAMASALRHADIFCAPAPHSGGAPKILIEAAASGLPIVAADGSGSRRVVHHGRNGLLVPPQNMDALEAAVLRLMGDGEFRRAAGSRSRERAVAEFSLDAALTAWLAVYRVTIGHHLVVARQ
jgi:glycosyltransferase involved in cell wall biosynthesis